MKRNTLWVAVIFVCAGGLAFAQEPAQTQGNSSPAPAQEEERMTWDDLKEEHRTFIEEQHGENQAWKEDFGQRWHQAVEGCKSGGLNPGECHQQYLKDLRQEAKAHRKEQIEDRQQHFQETIEKRKEHIQQWKESHPGVNPSGPIGGPGAGPHFKDRLEDVRDHREDIRDAREDVWDQREDVRDRREDVRDRKEDVIDRREDVHDRRDDRRDRGALPPPKKLFPQDVKKAYQEHPGAAQKAYKAADRHPDAAKKAYQAGKQHPGVVNAAVNHPGKARAAAGHRWRK